MQMTAAEHTGGPLERTSAELELLRRAAAFRRERELRSRRRLRESDLLLDLIEQCRLRGYRLLPAQLWTHIVRFVGTVDDDLRDDLGINRHPDHVSEILFAAQEELLREAIEERRPKRAPIIPLFAPRASAAAG
jgi:hypothetical protein